MRAAASPARAARVGRAGAATGAAVLVAVGAHLAGGGAAPAPLLVAGVLALAWPAAVALIGPRPRLWRQALVVGVAQLAMHLLLAAGGGAGAPAAAAGMPAMPGMTDAPMALSTETMHADPGMLGWHVAAWLATVAAWRWGERAVERLLAPVLAAVLLLAAAIRSSRPVAATAPADAPALLLAVLLDSASRRGPPRTA